jgi:enterochelin esterase-like enzyme
VHSPIFARAVGTDYGFRRADTALAKLLPQARFHVWPGRHETAYWRRHMREYLDFYSAALAAC